MKVMAIFTEVVDAEATHAAIVYYWLYKTIPSLRCIRESVSTMTIFQFNEGKGAIYLFSTDALMKDSWTWPTTRSLTRRGPSVPQKKRGDGLQRSAAADERPCSVPAEEGGSPACLGHVLIRRAAARIAGGGRGC